VSVFVVVVVDGNGIVNGSTGDTWKAARVAKAVDAHDDNA